MRARGGARDDAGLARLARVKDGPSLVWAGKRAPSPTGPVAHLVEVERVPGTDPGDADLVIQGDNLPVMRALLPRFEGAIDLVYLDPPFATGQDFELLEGHARRGAIAYRDRWDDGIDSYLTAMSERLAVVRRLMSDRGTLFLHCDWRTSHWMRCLLDEVFGPDAFKNEIVWRYRRWPAKTRVFQRMHDVLFWYGKRPGDAHTFHVMYEPLAESTRKTWGTKKQVADFSTGRRKPSQLDIETPGAPMSDVWEVGIIAPIAHERLGYPTQKPEALLERVIAAASRPGDLVADFFAGSGTTLAVAARLGRRFVGCDRGTIAVHTTRKRLLGIPRTRELRILEAEGARAASDEFDASAIVARVEVDRGMGRVALVGPPRALTQLDAWAVDWDHDEGGPFVTRWSAERSRTRDELELDSLPFPLPRRGRRVEVALWDAVGRRAWAEVVGVRSR